MDAIRHAWLVALLPIGGLANPAVAQQTAASAQDNAVALPPVVVIAPKERIAKRSYTSKKTVSDEYNDGPAVSKKLASKAKKKSDSGTQGEAPAATGSGSSGSASGADMDGIAASGGAGGSGSGGQRSSSGLNGVFALGELDMVGGTVVSSEAMYAFQKDSLDQSLALAPGVVASNSGGSRNEQLVFVRGFDRWQVPISIDGIRIYRPADNRFDFSSFLTPDMSEVQIAKGYTSVLNGPGGLGGAINLVTKKPQKKYEGEVQAGLMLGPDGEYEGYKTYASAGARQAGFYAQVSGIIIDRDKWHLSNDFNPTPIEDGDARDNSDKENHQFNVKVGVTPNSTDDYSINYARSTISRGAPYHVTDPINIQRYWVWDNTTTDNIYWLSHTKLGTSSFVDTKLYYSIYTDKLLSYDDPAQTTQALPKAFRSHYDDYGLGGSITAGTDITTWDTIKAAFHFRRDSHEETQAYNVRGISCASPPCFKEPSQKDLEDTYSVALENTVHINKKLDFVAGASYDWRRLHKAQEFTHPSTIFSYELKDSDAFNWQSALIYRYDPEITFHASVSDRTRFPTIFERFSSRFGGATSNPDLDPERAINYEIGFSNAFAPGSRIAGAVFYSDVKDIIQSVPFIYQGQAVNQSQNVGSGEYYGVEASADYAVSSDFVIGGNITWLHRDVSNPTNPHFELTGVPEVKGITYATYKFTEAFSITPSVEFATKRWTSTSNGLLYYKTGAFAIANLQAEYAFTPEMSLLVLGRNLLDEDYQLTDGYPEAGRSFQATLRTKF